MKKKLLLLSLLSLYLTFLSTTLYAGVEPSPFQPEINMIWAAEKGINSCLDRVQKVLSVPPDDQLPSPDLNGAVNRLEAIDGQVNSLNDFVSNTINSVMGFDPTPFRVDLIPALEAVDTVARSITTAVQDFLATSPDLHPDFISAVADIENSSLYLSETVMLGIEELSGGACVPAAIYDEVLCEDIGCTWIVQDAPAEPYCCCPQAGSLPQ